MERLTGEAIARSALGHDRYEELVALARAIDQRTLGRYLEARLEATNLLRDVPDKAGVGVPVQSREREDPRVE